MRFDLDLSNKVTGPNPEINVDFDLVFSCNNGVIQTQVKNVKVKEYGVYPLVGKAIKNLKGVLIGSMWRITLPWLRIGHS